jgi:hypothetical protein
MSNRTRSDEGSYDHMHKDTDALVPNKNSFLTMIHTLQPGANDSLIGLRSASP